MKTKYKLLLSGATSVCLFLTMPGIAQEVTEVSADAADEATLRQDVVTVNARKRDESVTDVPVSISVLNQGLIEDAGIVTQADLFELVPGIYYEEAIDRSSALPSVRGVQSNEIATNRTKVTQFIDGMPILGSQGNAPFGDAAQVEVYRGPQSAAFGRSTFGGAINYITKDPGDSLEAQLNLDANDYGRFIVGGTVSGPITDTLGLLVNASVEESDAPDEFIATDGTEYGTRSGVSVGAKLKFTPTDRFEAELAFSHVESDDGPSAVYFLSQSARDNCFIAGGSQLNVNMGNNPYYNGTFDCNWDQGAQIAAQNDRTALILANGPQPGETDEQFADRLFLAQAQSIPAGEVGAYDERERWTLQASYDFDAGTLQFSGFTGTEYYIRQNDTSLNAVEEISIALNPMTGFYTVTTQGPTATLGGIMSDPTDINEDYAEIRWVSPGEDRLRYVVGASYYDYDFLTDLYFGGYNATLLGQDAIDRYNALIGATPGSAADVSVPRQVFSETATNTGAFFNVAYDFTDKLTGSVEARYQVDKVGGTDSVSGASGEIETEAFLPRVALTYDISPSSSIYAQIAKGNNPGGVNVGFFNPANIAQLECAAGTIGPNGQLCGQTFVDYTASDFQYFEEETLVNYEIGYKGTAFNDNLAFSAAVYYLDWKDQTQTVNLSWADPTAMGPAADNSGNRTTLNQGDIESIGVEFEGTYRFTDKFNVRAQAAYIDATYADLCSVEVIGTTLDSDPNRILTPAQSGLAFTCYDVTGNEVVGQPKWTGSVSPSYRSPLGDTGMDFNLRADVRFENGRYLDAANVAKTQAFATVNLSAGLQKDNWNITAYVNNLFDEDTPLRYDGDEDFTIVNDALGLDGQNYLITPRQQRTVGVRLRYTY